MKRLNGMMLVMVGCGDLVRNKNGAVIEFTGFSETDADLKQLRDMPELETTPRTSPMPDWYISKV